MKKLILSIIRILLRFLKIESYVKNLYRKSRMPTPTRMYLSTSWFEIVHDMDEIPSICLKKRLSRRNKRSHSANTMSNRSSSSTTSRNGSLCTTSDLCYKHEAFAPINDALNLVKKANLLKKSMNLRLTHDPIKSPWSFSTSNSLYKTPNFSRLEIQKRLPKRLEDSVLEKMTIGDSNEVLVSKFGLEISRQNIECLLDGNWLNDEVINFYMSMLQIENNKFYDAGKAPRCYIFNTFFFPSLTGSGRGYNYTAVQRWTKRRRIDIFAVDMLLVPVHLSEVHWALGIIDMRPTSRQILMLDSLGGGGSELWFQAAKRYIKDEYKDKRREDLPIDDWKFIHNRVFKDVPLQENGYDCGVFMCQYAHCVVHQRCFDFTQEDIPSIRLLMAHEIIQGRIV